MVALDADGRYAYAINKIRDQGELDAEIRRRLGCQQQSGTRVIDSDELRRTLYSVDFEHHYPIHNAPADGELPALDVWNRLDKERRAQLVRFVLRSRPLDNAQMSAFEPMTTEQRGFLR